MAAPRVKWHAFIAANTAELAFSAPQAFKPSHYPSERAVGIFDFIQNSLFIST
jgi:hypothetical protein